MWVVIDILAGIDTPKLIVPDVFSAGFYSNPNRGFLINPFGQHLVHVQWKLSNVDIIGTEKWSDCMQGYNVSKYGIWASETANGVMFMELSSFQQVSNYDSLK